MITSIKSNPFMMERFKSGKTSEKRKSFVEKVEDAVASFDEGLRAVSDDGDSFNFNESDFQVKIESRPDYINDLATENFNTY